MNRYLKFLWGVFKGVSIGVGWFTMFNVIIGIVSPQHFISVSPVISENGYSTESDMRNCFLTSSLGDRGKPIFKICRIK